MESTWTYSYIEGLSIDIAPIYVLSVWEDTPTMADPGAFPYPSTYAYKPQ